jgi:hypothetical protein
MSLIKYFLGLYFCVFIFSCHNNDDATKPNAPASVPLQEADLKAAVNQYPDSLLLLQNLVAYYASTENYDAALASINQVLAKDSIRPDLLENLLWLHKKGIQPLP